MGRGTRPEDATLLDILVDGFEKNEISGNFHWRVLPLPNEELASRRFTALRDEAIRWRGAPERLEEGGPRRIAAWPDLQIRQSGRGVMVRARAPWFSSWWNDREAWEGDPLGDLYEWLREERG